MNMKLSEIVKLIMESRSEKVREDKVISLLKKNCSKYMKNPYQAVIHRGLGNTNPYLFINSTQSKPRTSMSGRNYGTLIMDNSSRWKKYPSRSKGIICSTDLDYVGAFGNPYIVVPFDGTKLGICPAEDVWYSFKKSFDKFNIRDVKSTSAFYRFSIEIVAKDYYDMNIDEYNFDKFKSDIIELGKKIKENPPEFKFKELDIIVDFIKSYKKFDGNLYEYMDSLLDPEFAGFDVITWPNKLPKRKEVWFEGQAVLIQNKKFKEVVAKYNEYI